MAFRSLYDWRVTLSLGSHRQQGRHGASQRISWNVRTVKKSSFGSRFQTSNPIQFRAPLPSQANIHGATYYLSPLTVGQMHQILRE